VFFHSEEDEQLKASVENGKTKDWEIIAKQMPGKSPRQCRERYINYLIPGLNLGPWTEEEDQLLAKGFREFGPRWIQIAQLFRDRSGTNVKNRWCHHVRSVDKVISVERRPPPAVFESERADTFALTRGDDVPLQENTDNPWKQSLSVDLIRFDDYDIFGEY
jgi:hypothetical protein